MTKEKKENGFSIFDHILVPVHEIVSQKERQELLNKYNIYEDNLPKIKMSDPAVTELKAKIGDVIKITRKSQTAGKSHYYRIVVH